MSALKPICARQTKKGTPCRNFAKLDGSPCHLHVPLCGRPTMKVSPCRNRVMLEGLACHLHRDIESFADRLSQLTDETPTTPEVHSSVPTDDTSSILSVSITNTISGHDTGNNFPEDEIAAVASDSTSTLDWPESPLQEDDKSSFSQANRQLLLGIKACLNLEHPHRPFDLWSRLRSIHSLANKSRKYDKIDPEMVWVCQAKTAVTLLDFAMDCESDEQTTVWLEMIAKLTAEDEIPCLGENRPSSSKSSASTVSEYTDTFADTAIEHDSAAVSEPTSLSTRIEDQYLNTFSQPFWSKLLGDFFR